MQLQDLVFVPYAQMLEALRGQLTQAAAFAEHKGFDVAVLLGARLAPDMFPLATQIRFGCVQAAEAWSRLTGGERPHTPEVATLTEALALLETNIVRLRQAATRDVLAEDSPVVLDLGGGIVLDVTLAEYVRSWSTPQFYFHLNTAYAIMRHNGVDLGKADYVPHMAQFARR